MTNKTPYEVRLDVMKMAQDMLNAEYQTNEQKFYHKLEMIRATAKPQDVLNYIEQNAPKRHDLQDVLKKSNELYSFITSNKRDGL